MRRRDVRALRQQSEEWRWSALEGEEDEDEDEVFEPEQDDGRSD